MRKNTLFGEGVCFVCVIVLNDSSVKLLLCNIYDIRINEFLGDKEFFVFK